MTNSVENPNNETKKKEDGSTSIKSKSHDLETGGAEGANLIKNKLDAKIENQKTTDADSPGKSDVSMPDNVDSSEKPDPSTFINSVQKQENTNKDIDNVDYFPSPNIYDATAFETASFWSESTSIHGAYYILERGHFATWKKLVWIAFVAIMFFFLLMVLISEIEEYFKYTVNSSTSNIVPPSLKFPEVTICNTNKYDSYLQNRTGISEPRNEEELNDISQPFENFIREAKFNGMQLRNLTDSFPPVITPFGRCYTFSTDEHVFVPGTAGGLELYLWLNQSAYDPATELAGVFVFIAQKGTTIMEQTPMVVVPPGMISFLSLGLEEYQRIRDEPWTTCVGKAPEDGSDLCRATCINQFTIQKCQCRPLGDTSDLTLRYCNSSDFNCTSSARMDDDLESLCTGCSVPPCEEEVYLAQYSTARVSLKASQQIENLYDATADGLSSMASNFVGIIVNYHSIDYDLTTESKATSLSQMISNMGGNFGFFMGISMISLVELVVELIGLRLLPRLWGNRQLFGIGQKQKYN